MAFGFVDSLCPAHNLVLEVELEALKVGLSLAWDHGLRNILCETDSLEACILLHGMLKHRNARVDCLIRELHGLLDYEWQAHICHVIRSTNMVANFLAKIGVTLEAGLQE